MVMTITERRKALEDIRYEANKLIVALREECTHPLYTAKYDASTGNWCEQDDRYWVDFHCPDCGWNWRAYTGDEEGDKYYRGNHERVIK